MVNALCDMRDRYKEEIKVIKDATESDVSDGAPRLDAVDQVPTKKLLTHCKILLTCYVLSPRYSRTCSACVTLARI